MLKHIVVGVQNSKLETDSLLQPLVGAVCDDVDDDDSMRATWCDDVAFVRIHSHFVFRQREVKRGKQHTQA